MCPANHRKRPQILRNLVPVILASQSPRRKELLARIGLEFKVSPSQIEESPPQGESPQEYVTKLAAEKAHSVAPRFSEAAVIAADTIVVLEGDILGKPRNLAHAKEMLKRLSGRRHQVFTGYAILYQGQERIKSVCTDVFFKELGPAEIEAYLATGEPLDKAGAYAIQGQASYMVKEIRGSVTNVIGLPLHEVVCDLLDLGVATWAVGEEK